MHATRYFNEQVLRKRPYIDMKMVAYGSGAKWSGLAKQNREF